MLAKSHADTAAVMQRDPGGAAGGVQERVQQRPVGYRVGAVLHRLGLAVGAGDRAGIQMIPADHHRRCQFSLRHHLVESEAQPVPLAEADPADARRQALELDTLARHVEPVMQMRVVGDQLLHLGVGAIDILRLARQRGPAERPYTAAEQRPDVGRHETRESEGVGHALVQRHLADIVAVIEGGGALFMEGQHRLDMHRHRFPRRCFHRRRVALAHFVPFLQRPVERQIAVDRIMGRCLVGHHVGAHAAPHQFRHHLGGIADHADRDGLALRAGLVDDRQRLVQPFGAAVEIARIEAALQVAGATFDGQHRGPGHGRGQRLRPAHAAESGGQDPLARKVAAIMPPAGLDEGLIGALDDALAADIDPGAGGHLAVHHQALGVEFVEMLPGRPVWHQVGVGDQHARGILMRAEHTDRLAGLHQQRLVGLQFAQALYDGVEAVPVARRPADAAIDDQLFRLLGHLGVEIVHQHPQRRLGGPRFSRNFGAAGAANLAGVGGKTRRRHDGPPAVGCVQIVRIRICPFAAVAASVEK